MPRKAKQGAEPTPIDSGRLIDAALNKPSGTFTLGDREFPIVDLPYREYLAFVQYLTPFVTSVAAAYIPAEMRSMIPGMSIMPTVDAAGLITMCGDKLPEMVQLLCRQSDPTVTVEEVERLGRRPSAFIAPVILAIQKNEVIREFASFFAQVTRILNPNAQSQNSSPVMTTPLG